MDGKGTISLVQFLIFINVSSKKEEFIFRFRLILLGKINFFSIAFRIFTHNISIRYTRVYVAM